MAGPSFHIRCPACGQPFVTPLDHPQMAQACPFCQFNGLRGQFGPASDPAPPRKESRRFAPSPQPYPTPQSWEVQQYSAPPQVPVQPVFSPRPAAQSPTAAPPMPAPGTPEWAAVQAYKEMQNAASLVPLSPPQTTPPPANPPPPADWAPMKPSNLPKLTPWPGLDPTTGTSDVPAPWDPAVQPRRFPWALALVSLVILGLIAALVLERKRANETVATIAKDMPSPRDKVAPEEGTIAKAIPVERKPVPKECLLSPEDSETLVRSLIERLFAATTNIERLSCIASPDKNSESVADFFKRHSQVSLTKLSSINKTVRCLPNPSAQVIFDITTNLSAENSGIVRLMTDEAGELKLDWLLLHDSLDGVFAEYQKLPPGPVPQWVCVGLHRNYGFGEPTELREGNLFFDMQGYGNGSDKAMVITVKNSSTGLAMDSTLGWGDLFIVRVLIGWQDFNGKPRLTVIKAMLDDSGIGT